MWSPRLGCFARRSTTRSRRCPGTRAAIKDLEHAGDELTHEIIQTLHRTFITPFEREDIYALSSGLDDVLDYIDEIAETIILYGITDISAGGEIHGRTDR